MSLFHHMLRAAAGAGVDTPDVTVPDPVLFYSMDIIEEGVVQDGSGNGFDGTLSGSVTTSTGVSGEALFFSGGSAILNVAGDLELSERSLCCFVKPRSTPSGQGLYILDTTEKATSSHQYGDWGVNIWTLERIIINYDRYNGSYAQASFDLTEPLPTDAFTFIYADVTDTGCILQINGTVYEEVALTRPKAGVNVGSLAVGNRLASTSSPSNHDIDYLNIYPRRLTETERDFVRNYMPVP